MIRTFYDNIGYLAPACRRLKVLLFSALYQGHVCAAGIEMLARQPKELVKPLMMAVLVEFYAILGFTASFLLVNGINLG